MATITPTLDQLRVFAAVAEAGSFSAAAARLGRSQPTVSYVTGSLEAQLGFSLFERGKRKPMLTERGAAVLAHARRLCLLTDELIASAENLRRGEETEFTLAVDPLFPSDRLAGMLREFSTLHPMASVTLRTEPLGGVLDLVMQRQCQLGISAVMIDWPDMIEPREFGVLDMVPVAAPSHALAQSAQMPTAAVIREYLQLILLDPGSLTQEVDFAVTGVRTWRVTEFATKLALLRTGVGWGHMPLHLVADDLTRGSLVKLKMPVRPGGRQAFTLLHRSDVPPSESARWVMEHLIAWD